MKNEVSQKKERSEEEKFQDLFDLCNRELSYFDPTAYLTRGFNTLLSYHVPTIVKQYGAVTTLIKGLKYTFSIKNVCSYNSVIKPSDCFDFGLSRTIPITGILTVDVVPLLGVDHIPPVVLSSVRAVIAHLPFPTGRSALYHHAHEDANVENEFLPSGTFISHGKPRSLPPVKHMRYNIPLLSIKKDYVMLQIRSIDSEKPFRSSSSLDFVIQKDVTKAQNLGVISCCLPFSTIKVHIGILALAFGCPPPCFIALIRAQMGKLYDEKVFRPYEISMMYDKTILASPAQELATRSISRIFGRDITSTGQNQLKTEVFPHINIAFQDTEGNIVDVEGMYATKVLFLARCAGLVILLAAGRVSDTPRDYLTYASFVTPAYYIGMLFRILFMAHVKSIGKTMRKKLTTMFKKTPDKYTFLNLVQLYGEARLSGKLLSAVASGGWPSARKGITLPMNTVNMDGFLEQLLRLSSSLHTTDAAHTNPRHVQHDGYGRICAASTPDGKEVGLVMSIAKYAFITPDLQYPEQLAKLLEFMFKSFLVPISKVLKADFAQSMALSQLDTLQRSQQEIPTFGTFMNTHYLYFNNCGIPTHFISDCLVNLFVDEFRDRRRQGDIPNLAFLQKYEQRKELHVICESGQIVRPVIVAENLYRARRGQDFSEMLKLGVVEYLNAAEEQSLCNVAVCFEDFLKHRDAPNAPPITHIELDQVTFVSRAVSQVPFLTSQAGARATYASQQDRQKFAAEMNEARGSVVSARLWYASRALVSTISGDRLANECFKAIPVVIAVVASKSQEDAYEINLAAIQRGLGAAETTRHFTSEAPTKKSSTYREVFGKPDAENTLSRKDVDYGTIDADGFPAMRTCVEPNGVVMGKMRTTCIPVMTTCKKEEKSLNNSSSSSSSSSSASSAGEVSKRKKKAAATPKDSKFITSTHCISITTRPDEKGQVTDVTFGKTPHSERGRVSVTSTRFVEPGDKFTSLHSQKGVSDLFTKPENMMYSLSTGVPVDMIIGPLSVHSRMTMASIKEILAGKAVALKGEFQKYGIDYQRFNESSESFIKELCDVLKEAGFRSGKEKFVNGCTGELIDGMIFSGVMTVFRLIQLAVKKIHGRDIGPLEQIIRQPREGRRFGGGLRFGPMERAAAMAHGAARIVQTRFKQLSDPFKVFICAKCKMIADGNEDTNYSFCRLCQSNEKVFLVSIPFTFLVTLTELMAMGIAVRIALTESDVEKTSSNKYRWLKLFKTKRRRCFA